MQICKYFCLPGCSLLLRSAQFWSSISGYMSSPVTLEHQNDASLQSISSLPRDLRQSHAPFEMSSLPNSMQESSSAETPKLRAAASGVSIDSHDLDEIASKYAVRATITALPPLPAVPPTAETHSSREFDSIEDKEHTPDQPAPSFFTVFREPVENLQLRFGDDASFNVFSIDSCFRRVCIACMENVWFVRAVIAVILLNCITLVLTTRYVPGSTGAKVLVYFENLFLVIFCIEAFIKMVAGGVLWCGKASYFKQPWNIFDFLIVILSLVALFGASFNLSYIRTLRVLRPLRTISNVEGLRVMIVSLWTALPQLINVMGLLFLMMFLFALVGRQLFAGMFRNRCFWIATGSMVDGTTLCTKRPDSSFIYSTGSTCPTGAYCADAGFSTDPLVFDTTGTAMITIFTIITGEGWSNVMYNSWDTTQKWTSLYYIALMVVIYVFVVQLVSAVMTFRFEEAKAQLSFQEKVKEGAAGGLLTPKFTFSPLASDVHVNAEIETDFATDLVLAERSDQLDQTNDEQFVCDNEHYGQDGDAHCCSMFLIGLQIRVWIPLKRLRRNMSSKCRRVAASVEWHRVALAVIFCNFVALLMQYYKAPPAYANVLDQLNRAFTFFFCLELFVLVFALSPSVYIKRWSNIWDFGIVITSLIELVLDAQYVGAISSFRALRLFRLVKLLRSWPTFTNLVKTFQSCLQDLSYFFVILFLYLFVSSLAAMDMFRGKMVYQGVNARNNFDGWGWAMITSFQIMTPENFSQVCIDGIRAVGYGGGLFLVMVMFIGHYVLEVLFLVIIVASFDEDNAEAANNGEQLTLPEKLFRLILKLRARSLNAGRNFVRSETKADHDLQDLLNRSRIIEVAEHAHSVALEQWTDLSEPHHSNSFIVPPTMLLFPTTSFDRLAHVNPICSPDEQPQVSTSQHIRKLMALMAFNRASDTSLNFVDRFSASLPHHHRAYDTILFRKWSHQERLREMSAAEIAAFNAAADLQKEAAQEMDTRVPTEPVLDGTEIKGVELESAITQLYATMDPDEAAIQTAQRLAEEEEANLVDGQVVSEYPSFYLFSTTNPIRRFCLELIRLDAFNLFITLLIAFSCVTLAMDSPSVVPQSPMSRFLNNTDIAIAIIFLIELIMKSIAFGFVLHPHSYLRNKWNQVDFFVSISSCVAIGVQRVSVLRMLRVFRPIRLLNRLPSMRLVALSIISSVPKSASVFLFMIVVFAVLGIVSVQFFSGYLWQCFDPVEFVTVSLNQTSCVAPYVWTNPPGTGHFDNVGSALLVMFELATEENWPNTMYAYVDYAGPGKAPVINSNQWVALWFVICILINSFFVKDLFIGTVIDTYNSNFALHAGLSSLTDSEKEWVSVYKMIVDSPPLSLFPRPSFAWFSSVDLKIRQFCWRVVSDPRFDNVTLVVIFINLVLFAMDYYNAPRAYSNTLQICNEIITILFMVEMLMKLLGVGVLNYWRSGWNRFDCIITLFGFAEFLYFVHAIDGDFFIGFDPTMLRFLRMLRIIRSLRYFGMVSQLVRTLMHALPSAAHVSLLVILLFYCYAVVGMAAFSQVRGGNGIDKHGNFRDFISSWMLLFRCFTGEAWNAVMRDCMVQPPFCDLALGNCGNLVGGAVYWVSFQILTSFLFINVVVAVVLQVFEDDNASHGVSGWTDSSLTPVSQENLDRFRLAWSRFTVGPLMPVGSLQDFLLSFSSELGYQGNDFASSLGRGRFTRLIELLNLPSDGQNVHYVDVFYRLAWNAMRVHRIRFFFIALARAAIQANESLDSAFAEYKSVGVGARLIKPHPVEGSADTPAVALELINMPTNAEIELINFVGSLLPRSVGLTVDVFNAATDLIRAAVYREYSELAEHDKWRYKASHVNAVVFLQRAWREMRRRRNKKA